MKIQEKLVEMVADLNSEERQKREEVEAILSKIHELTAAYFEPEKEVGPFDKGLHEEPSEPVQELSDMERVENFTKAFERRGMPPERARDAAEEACGLRDGSR